MYVKRVSYWGSRNPIKARLLILLLHAIMAPACFLLGIRLYIQEVELPAELFTGLMLFFVVLCLFYPGKFYRKFLVPKTWRNQKVFDSAILAVSVGVMIFLGNVFPEQTSPSEIMEAQAIPIVHQEQLDTRKEIRLERKTLRQQWRSWKQDVRELRKEYRQQQAAGESNLVALWIILLCLGAIVIWFFLIFLACAVSCNGMEALGAAIGIVGTLAIILGLILGIRALLNNNRENVDLGVSP